MIDVQSKITIHPQGGRVDLQAGTAGRTYTYKKEKIMRFRVTSLIVALVAICLIPSAAFASGSNDVCPAPTKAALVKCYNHNSSARALYDSVGITLHGIKTAKSKTICATGGYTSYGRNWTKGSRKVTPDGHTFYKRSLASVMHGCAPAWKIRTKSGYVYVLKFCGNPETKPCSCKPHKKHKTKPTPTQTPTPPSFSCPAGWMMNSAGTQCTQQVNQAEQNCKDSGGTWDSDKQQCTIVQTNGNCSNIVVVNGSGNTVNNYQQGNCNQQEETCVQNGGDWNSQSNICTQSSCQEQGTCQPMKPQVSCIFGEHVKVGDKIFIYCQVSGGDGKTPPALDVQGDSHLQVNNVITQTTQYDGSACPSGVTCFRVTATGLSVGQATVTAVARVDGVASDPTVGNVQVVDSDSGF